VERGLTRRDFLARSGALAGAAVLAPLAFVRVPDAAAAGTFLDEARFSFDPYQLLEPDRAVWARSGTLEPALTSSGLGVSGVGGTLSYARSLEPLAAGLGGAITAQIVAGPVPDESGAWVDDAISPRVHLAGAELAFARDPNSGERQLRLEGVPGAAPIPFPWDNGHANIVDLHVRTDGLVEVRATSTDPNGGFVGPSNQLYDVEISGGSAGFKWDRDRRTDEDSSCFVRVTSLWGGRGWGSLSLPEIGDEVVVAFEAGDPDKPIVVGSVYGAEHRFPQPFDPQLEALACTRSSSAGEIRRDGTDPARVVRRRDGFRFEERLGRARLDVMLEPIEAPFDWRLRLEGRNQPTLFQLPVVEVDGVLYASLYRELQIGDMTGAKLVRVSGRRRGKSAVLRSAPRAAAAAP
jgi:type VI secretion system (T6SS) baseplate-like injector VgrG